MHFLEHVSLAEILLIAACKAVVPNRLPEELPEEPWKPANGATECSIQNHMPQTMHRIVLQMGSSEHNRSRESPVVWEPLGDCMGIWTAKMLMVRARMA